MNINLILQKNDQVVVLQIYKRPMLDLLSTCDKDIIAVIGITECVRHTSTHYLGRGPTYGITRRHIPHNNTSNYTNN